MQPKQRSTGPATPEFAIVIPTFKRAEKLKDLAASLAASTRVPYSLFFVVEREDQPTIDAANRLGASVIFNEGPGTYASCVNTAYRMTAEPYLLIGADDIRFGDHCLEAARAALADESIGVIGAFDPQNVKGDHADHYVVRRRYIDEHGGSLDARGTVLHPYGHAFTDVELVSVAKVRGAFAFAHEFQILHDHPGWDFGGTVDRTSDLFDETYAKGNASHSADARLYGVRSRMWRRALIARPQATKMDRHFAFMGRVNDPRIGFFYKPSAIVQRANLALRRRIPARIKRQIRERRDHRNDQELQP
ncbi:MAG: glycosyltransferase involved in cell wall biosynthesis [Ilumatobacter sp.]